ncbi:DUF2089 family protein [Paenibacillus woosongensis]|uniref:DUF2089 family protein n=1 Tax=Paenibacillus woosongensis TaxID=307580 RepID=A0A7X2YYL6_9BACL|nr:DUF2089 family protein [Paenibacillus woosongensis]MUG44225.1 DUF2089 family protein [Paenibacillus woosongensis]
MGERNIPLWILSLDSEDIEFMRKFIVNSGSLKDLAKAYEVSYPTVRIRLDRLIQKIELAQNDESQPLVNFVKKLAIEERITLEDARLIIEKYNAERKGI